MPRVDQGPVVGGDEVHRIVEKILAMEGAGGGLGFLTEDEIDVSVGEGDVGGLDVGLDNLDGKLGVLGLELGESGGQQ